jgi:hypothetical protein
LDSYPGPIFCHQLIIVNLLKECTPKRLAEDVRSGKYRLADLPPAAITQALPHGMREKLYGED